MSDAPPLALAVCVLGLVLLVGALSQLVAGTPPLEKKPLMTRRERAVIQIIERSYPWVRVHSQVPMGALIRPKRGLSRSAHQSWRGRYSQKIIDYVLEERETGHVLALVELDDRTHNASKDAARDRLTAAAGYLTIRLPAGEQPTTANIRRRLGNALGQTGPFASAARQ